MRTRTTVASGLMITLLVGATYLILCAKVPRESSASSASAPLPLQNVVGIIRDFRPSHPDFNVTPSTGYGHVCGNVDTHLDADGKPVFTDHGFRVAQEWRDSHCRQIARCMDDATN